MIGTIDIKKVAKKFLAYISEFKKEVFYADLTEDERSDFEQYEEAIESTLDDRDMYSTFLPIYIDKLVEIIRSKKKLI